MSLSNLLSRPIAVPIAGESSEVVWTPNDMTSLLFWYDPSDTDTLTLDGNSVTAIENKEGTTSYNLLQGSASIQPQSGTQTINGVNVLECINGDVLMDAGASVPMLDGDDICVSIIYQPQSTALHRPLVVDGGVSLSGVARIDNNGFANFFGALWSLTMTPTTNAQLQTVHMDDVSSTLWRDGSQEDINAFTDQTGQTAVNIAYGGSNPSATN